MNFWRKGWVFIGVLWVSGSPLFALTLRDLDCALSVVYAAHRDSLRERFPTEGRVWMKSAEGEAQRILFEPLHSLSAHYWEIVENESPFARRYAALVNRAFAEKLTRSSPYTSQEMVAKATGEAPSPEGIFFIAHADRPLAAAVAEYLETHEALFTNVPRVMLVSATFPMAPSLFDKLSRAVFSNEGHFSGTIDSPRFYLASEYLRTLRNAIGHLSASNRYAGHQQIEFVIPTSLNPIERLPSGALDSSRRLERLTEQIFLTKARSRYFFRPKITATTFQNAPAIAASVRMKRKNFVARFIFVN